MDAGSPSGFQRSSQQLEPKGWVSVVNFIIQYPNFVVIKIKDYLVFIYKGLKFISLSESVNRKFDFIIYLRHLSGAQLSCQFYLRLNSWGSFWDKFLASAVIVTVIGTWNVTGPPRNVNGLTLLLQLTNWRSTHLIKALPCLCSFFCLNLVFAKSCQDFFAISSRLNAQFSECFRKVLEISAFLEVQLTMRI